MKFSITLYFLLSIFISLPSLAQERTIKGSLKLLDGTPVSNATISILHTDIQTISDERGNFTLRNLTFSKTYEIEVQSMEIKKEIFGVKIDENDPFIRLTVQPASDISLKEVVIQQKTEKAKIETKGFAVNVIETQKAALQSLQTNELLDRSAGVKIRQDGGLGSHVHYNINGLSGNAVKIFIDGVPSSNYGQSFSLNSIPPALIERIEVYKGVLPGYLSEDALGGAINVVMKQNKKNTMNASYSLGSFNTHQFNVNGGYKTDKGLLIDASIFYNYSDNNYKVWGPTIAFNDYLGGVFPNQTAKRFHDAYRSYGTKLEVGYANVKWADRFTIGGVFSDEYNEIQHGITMYRPFGNRHSTRNANVATLNYLKKDLLLSGLILRADASYSYLKTQVIDSVGIRYDWTGEPIWNPDTEEYMRYGSNSELGRAQTTEINSDKTVNVRAALSYEINKRNILYINYLFNNFDRGFSDDFLPLGMQLLQNTRDLQKNIATFTYENISLSDKLRTNVFYKYYHQQVTANAPYQITATPAEYGLNITEKTNKYDGYGITFSYAVLSRLYVMGSAEKAIRFPNATELFGNAAESQNPSNSLEPEKSLNANIGIILGAYTFDKNSLRINTSVFYRDTEDMIRLGFAANSTGESYYENLESVISKGIDAEISYNYAERVNFTFNISKFDVLFNTKYDKTGATYLYYRSQIRNEPSFKFNANLAYFHEGLFQKNSRSSVYYNLGYVKGFLRNWANAGRNNLDWIPTQISNDIGILYTFPSGRISLSLDSKNIFNRQIFDNYGLQKPGRAFYGKISYTIF